MTYATHASNFASPAPDVLHAVNPATPAAHSRDEELQELLSLCRIGSSWYHPSSACYIAWNRESDFSQWLKQLPPEHLERISKIVHMFSTDAIEPVLRLDTPRVTKFCAVLDTLVARNLIRFWKKPSYSEVFCNPNDEELRAFLELPVEMCAILLERDQGDSYQLDFLRTSPQAVEWILQLTPNMLDALFENFHAYAETSDKFVAALSNFTSDRDILARTDQWSDWALVINCVPSELAFQIAVTRFESHDDCQKFMHLAHEALFGHTDSEEFDELFRVDDPIEEICNWLRDRVWMHKYEAATTHIRRR